MNKASFFAKGWCAFDFDPLLKNWVDHVLPRAREVVGDESNGKWFRCGGTWFAGVNVMPNTGKGEIGGSGPLEGGAMNFIGEVLGLAGLPLDAGQLSVCYPGYPRPMDSETLQAHRYRVNRDASHVDGLIPEGPRRRRYLRQHHGFILGIPLANFSKEAAPFVIWEGSHEMIRGAFAEAFAGSRPPRWGTVDVTDAYRHIRKKIFETCKRVTIHAEPGESFIVHRLALHGMAPWGRNGEAGPDGRMICYFRPETGGPERWLHAP